MSGSSEAQRETVQELFGIDSKEKEVLIIAYTSGNIDLYDNGRTTNIPDILNTVIPGDKSINRIRSYGNYAYLASNLGIILLDIDNREIKDTYKPSVDGDKNPVFDINILGDTIFAATENGLYKAPKNNQGLSYFNNWIPVDNTLGISFTCLASTTSGLYANKKNDGKVKYIKMTAAECQKTVPDQTVVDLAPLTCSRSGLILRQHISDISGCPGFHT